MTVKEIRELLPVGTNSYLVIANADREDLAEGHPEDLTHEYDNFDVGLMYPTYIHERCRTIPTIVICI